MKKLLILLIILILNLSISSCHKIAGNQLRFYYRNDLTISNTEQYPGYDIYDTNIVLEGGDAPRYGLYISEEYEYINPNIINKVKELNWLSIDSSVFYTKVYMIDDKLLGICNVYSDTIGYLSGGGNYGEEEISYSLYFEYDNELDKIKIIKQVDEALMVGFSSNSVTYWKQKKLYNYNLEEDKEYFICKDYSYDSGFQHQSYGYIYFNEDYVLLIFNKAYLFSDKAYRYIYDLNTHNLTDLM